MRLPACIVASLLLLACTLTHAAEPQAASPTARVRVALNPARPAPN